MKILLDECIPKRLKEFIKGRDAFTVSELGWSGVKNGELLALCAENKFDILITIDKNIIHQQNIKNYDLTVVVLNSRTSKVEELARFLPAFENQIADFKKGEFYLIDAA